MNLQMEMFMHQIEKDKRKNIILAQKMLEMGVDPNLVESTPTTYSDLVINKLKKSCGSQILNLSSSNNSSDNRFICLFPLVGSLIELFSI